MRQLQSRFNQFAALLLTVLFQAQLALAKEIVRPEEIKSKRHVICSSEKNVELARLLKEYNDEHPSEYANAYWMYAARYAGDMDYATLSADDLSKWPTPNLSYRI